MFLHFLLQFQKAKDLGRGAVGLLELLVHAAHSLDRLVGFEKGIDEGEEGAGSHHAMLDLFTRVKQNHGEHHGAQNVHERTTDYKRANPTHVLTKQSPRPVAELGDLEALHAKRLYHTISAQRLLED